MRCFVIATVALVAVSAQRSADSKNCKKPTGLFPHEKYCDYYYDCIDGEAILQACPNGLAYAGKQKGLLQNCDYPHKVDCPDDEGRVMGQSPESTDNCHYKYGIFAHATSCTRYWQCWNGTSTNQQCPFSLLYNDASHSCDWPDNVPDCQKHPICKDVANGPIPIEKSCARYWLCVGGYPRLQRCAAGLAFNPESIKCELADTVAGCEPPPTTPSDEEDRPAPKPQRSQSGGRPVQVVQTRPQPPAQSTPQFRPQPVQQFRPQPAPTQPPPPPAAADSEYEDEYEGDEATDAPTTQRPRRRQFQG